MATYPNMTGGINQRCRGFAVCTVILLCASYAVPQAAHAQQESDSGRWAEEERAGTLFGNLVGLLGDALALVDRHDDLPAKRFFGQDQRSNRREIEELLDQAVDMLNVSPVQNDRVHIRELQGQVKSSQNDIAEYRRQKVSAPREKDLRLLGKINPLKKTKEYYDELIEEEEEKVEEYREEINTTKKSFAEGLRHMGLSVTDEAADSLLTSIAGDDFVEMAVVFDNLKAITVLLQELTEDSGEVLDVARRYYGMYLVLIDTLDHVQDEFVMTIEDAYVPKLEDLMEVAQVNIDEAMGLLAADDRNGDVLQGNIDSNKLTIRAAQLYILYLEQQIEMIEQENEKVENNLAVARNTYKTVEVSSRVAALLGDGKKQFGALMRLEMPVLREFENRALEQEFQRLTEEMRSGG